MLQKQCERPSDSGNTEVSSTHRVSESDLVSERRNWRERRRNREGDGDRKRERERESGTKVWPLCTIALNCWIPTPNVKDGVDRLSGRLPKSPAPQYGRRLKGRSEDRGGRRGRAGAMSTALRAPTGWLPRCVSAGAPASPAADTQPQKTVENLRKPQGSSEKRPLSQSVREHAHTCLEAVRVQKTSSQPLHRHFVGVWTLVPPWSATRWCCRCSCWPNTREQPCHCRERMRERECVTK